jgi:hypothetical protein
MQLTEAQAQEARRWLEDGMKLSEFQKRLEKDFGLKGTYMEVRLLVDDLRVQLKDPEPPKAPAPAPAAAPAPGGGLVDAGGTPTPGADTGGSGGGVSITVDTVTRPGTLTSGTVKFSDGQSAQWYLDQMGRFGMVPPVRGYRPSQEDLQEFQMLLDRELQKLGI